MKRCKNYKSWQSLARLLDHIEGLLDWKLRYESSNYDFERIRRRYDYM